MKAIDIVILIILVLGAFRGFQKGLFLELVGLVAFVVGIIGGFRLTPQGAKILGSFFSSVPGVAHIVAFLIIFVIIVLLINLLGGVVKKTIDLTILGSFDNLAGSLAGVIKWAFALSFLLWLLGFFGFQLSSQYTEGASVYPLLVGLAPWMIDTISAMLPFVKEYFDAIKPQQKKQEYQAIFHTLCRYQRAV